MIVVTKFRNVVYADCNYGVELTILSLFGTGISVEFMPPRAGRVTVAFTSPSFGVQQDFRIIVGGTDGHGISADVTQPIMNVPIFFFLPFYRHNIGSVIDGPIFGNTKTAGVFGLSVLEVYCLDPSVLD